MSYFLNMNDVFITDSILLATTTIIRWLSVGVIAQWQSTGGLSQRPWVWFLAAPVFFLFFCHFKGLRTLTAQITSIGLWTWVHPVYRAPYAVISSRFFRNHKTYTAIITYISTTKIIVLWHKWLVACPRMNVGNQLPHVTCPYLYIPICKYHKSLMKAAIILPKCLY